MSTKRATTRKSIMMSSDDNDDLIKFVEDTIVERTQDQPATLLLA